jgi:hypothetical protein
LPYVLSAQTGRSATPATLIESSVESGLVVDSVSESLHPSTPAAMAMLAPQRAIIVQRVS